MEIKIKIPTFYAKYRIVKKDGKFLAQIKSGTSNWYSVDRKNPDKTWTKTYEMKYASTNTFDEAMALINRSKVDIVWEGR